MAPPNGEGQSLPPSVLAHSWEATLFLGVATVVIGLIVSFHPSGSLNVLAVLVGVLMILSGVFNLIRVFDPKEYHRVWLGVAGLLFIALGVYLIRHLHVTIAIIGVIIGIAWIIQGLVALIGPFGFQRGVTVGSRSQLGCPA